ncbi:MAG TPA: uroporphyrinogen-III synthase [Vicinamibacteria bacterium]|nr:uroporphyrinogen-III synthase [Vicinamibacteria bacterium]
MTAEAWGPLTGRRILVTRRPEQSASLTGPLRALGATVLELPLIEIRPPLDCGPLDRALSRLSEYDWLVFTSSNAVEAVAERRAVLGLVGALPKVAVVGPATRDALALAFGGVTPDLEPVQEHRAEGLLHAFASWDLSGRKVLLPLSARARDTLASGLGHRGALVDTVIAYRTEQPQGLGEELRTLLDRGLDLVVLASPSAVEGLAAAAGPDLAGVRVAVIGPVTEEAARRAGCDVVVVAKPSTAAGLLAAVASSPAFVSPTGRTGNSP